MATGFDGGTAEYFSRRTDPAFDPLAAASIAADLTLGALFDANRVARLNDFHAQNPANPDFKEVLDAVVAATWKGPRPQNAYHTALAETTQALVVKRLMDLAANGDVSPQVRATASQGLRELDAWLSGAASASLKAAHRNATRDDIKRFLNRPEATFKPLAPLPIPPGDPIGATTRQP